MEVVEQEVVPLLGSRQTRTVSRTASGTARHELLRKLDEAGEVGTIVA